MNTPVIIRYLASTQLTEIQAVYHQGPISLYAISDSRLDESHTDTAPDTSPRHLETCQTMTAVANGLNSKIWVGLRTILCLYSSEKPTKLIGTPPAGPTFEGSSSSWPMYRKSTTTSYISTPTNFVTCSGGGG